MSTWYPDPLGRHQERFHDGVRWTDQVRDRGVVNRDAAGLDGVQTPVAPVVAPASMTMTTPSTMPAVPVVHAVSTGTPAASGAAPGSGPGSVIGTAAVPNQSLASLSKTSVVTGVVAGGLGGLLGMAAAEILHSPDRMDLSASPKASIAVWTAIVGVVLGFVLGGWGPATTGRWDRVLVEGGRSALGGLVAGGLGGYAAQALYEWSLQHINSWDLGSTDLRLKLAAIRGLGWSVFGASLGLALGVGSGSRRMAAGLAGGAVGGFVGGLTFGILGFWIFDDLESGTVLRAIGVTVTGIGVGLGVGVAERVLRRHWITLRGGPLDGREVILYKPVTTLGSAATCDVALANDPSVGAVHLSLQPSPGGVVVTPHAAVAIAGAAVTSPVVVGDGQTVQVGKTLVEIHHRGTR